MSKNHSAIELLATDKKRKKEYQMKTASYSNLPIRHNYKQTNKCPTKFPNVINGFAIPLSLKQIPDKLKFQAIVTELYNFLNIDDLEKMTINKQNCLEIKQSSFLAVCSFCKNDITTSNNLKSCRTEGCLYKMCSHSECHHFLENKYYCNN